MVWNSNTTRSKTEKAEVSNIAKPANTDKLVLNLPVNETVYNRQGFVSDEHMGEGCAFCCTYMERTLTFASGKCGALTFKSSGGLLAGIAGEKSRLPQLTSLYGYLYETRGV